MKSKDWSKQSTDLSIWAGVILMSYGVIAFLAHFFEFAPMIFGGEAANPLQDMFNQILPFTWFLLDLGFFLSGWQILQDKKWAYWLGLIVVLIAGVNSMTALIQGDAQQLTPLLAQILVFGLILAEHKDFIGSKKK